MRLSRLVVSCCMPERPSVEQEVARITSESRDSAAPQPGHDGGPDRSRQAAPVRDKLLQCLVSADIVQPLAPMFDTSIMRRNDLRDLRRGCNSRRLHWKATCNDLQVAFLLRLDANSRSGGPQRRNVDEVVKITPGHRRHPPPSLLSAIDRLPVDAHEPRKQPGLRLARSTGTQLIPLLNYS